MCHRSPTVWCEAKGNDRRERDFCRLSAVCGKGTEGSEISPSARSAIKGTASEDDSFRVESVSQGKSSDFFEH